MPPEEYLKICPYLEPEDIAAGLLYVLGAPPHVQVRVVCDVRFYSDFPRVVSLTPWSRFSLEKLTVAKMAEFHYHAHNSLAPIPYHSDINPVYAFHPNLLESAIFKSTRGSSKLSPSSRFSNQNIVNIFGFPLACHIRSPSYPSLFGYTNGVRRRIQLIIQICVFCIIRNNFLTT